MSETSDNPRDNPSDSGAEHPDVTVEPPLEDPRPDGLRSAPSLLLVNTGNGKGKSSAAFGVMVRGVARGWKVAVLQFLKSGDWKVGEEAVGRQLGVDWWALGGGFTWDSTNIDADKRLAVSAWETARGIVQAGAHDLVILDELTYMMNWGWVDAADVVDVLRNRPPSVNVIVTGRDASEELIAIADTVTEMREVKHAYQSGIRAKRGIDY
jgi:cob(I)alamin adenosyltransferase